MTEQSKIQWYSRAEDRPFEVVIGRYPSGEPMIPFPSSVLADRMLIRPLSMLDFMGALFFVDAMTERGHKVPELILPFVPGARQDRMNGEGDYLFTAKSVAREINARAFPRVTVVDPHSEVISGLIDRCHVVHAVDCLNLSPGALAPTRYVAVISPDAGAEKRASAVARWLQLPLLHGWKTRDVSNGKITGFGLEPTTDLTQGSIGYPDVLVVDDICDGGGTFIGLAAVIKERDLRADLFVTHGIFSQGTGKLLENYRKVFCTDSLPGDRPGVEVLSVCDNLLKGKS
jgi:ribose-phosphate pyrophosphokinase